jgi:peptidyl-prolyl cis-trans isomerase B (cyclophilin B)
MERDRSLRKFTADIMFSSILKFVFALSLILLVSCNDPVVSNNSAPIQKPAIAKTEAPIAKLPKLSDSATVEMKLKDGTVIMEIDGKNAPVTAGNFIDLVKRGFYTNLTFHRVVKDPSPFVAQGGDPLGTGTGSFVDPVTAQPRYVPLEILPDGEKVPVYSKTLPNGQKVKLPHTKGAVAMARSQAPDSASSQFYITLADVNFLDGSYAVFGYVTSGMDVVEKIKVGDRIVSMKVIKGAENLVTN